MTNPIWKRHGFRSPREYREHLAKQKGFKSYYEYRKHLIKEKGFKGLPVDCIECPACHSSNITKK